MSEFGADLFRRMQARVRERSNPANRRALLSILPLRKSSPRCERLPWEPDSIELTPVERQLLAWLSQELNCELAPEELISESEILNFALEELQLKLRGGNRQDVLLRLGFHVLNLRQ